MQYQNAKRNTLNLNKWTPIVNTSSRINAELQGSNSFSFIMPGSTWCNTTQYSSEFYSGYQLFIQSFGAQNLTTAVVPSYTIQTELVVEFLQPAFQNGVSTFTQDVFEATLSVIPDGSAPETFRDYIFERITAEPDADGKPELLTFFKRADGQPGNVSYNQEQLLSLYEEGTSQQYFGNRRCIYTGPVPEQFRV